MAIVPQQSVADRIPYLNPLNNQRMFGLMVAVAALAALLVGGWMWGHAPDYRVLYSNLPDRDGGAIIGALQQMNIPYKFTDGGGAILVPATQVHEARLRLAGQGLPKGGLVGFELMENQKLGTSQFLEQVNYQRALEGELARSIQSLSAVQGARVHLAIPKPSVFVRDVQKPSASVLVNLYPGRSLEPTQVAAVAHMVSSSVPELLVKNVTVIDQNGNLLSQTADGNNVAALDPAQLKYLREVEQEFVKRIEAILTPITGPGNVRAQVTADVDFSQTEQAAEIYKPNQGSAQAAIRSQQSAESVAGGNTQPVGVPGALSNQPPAPATAPVTAPATGAVSAAASAVPAAQPVPVNSRKDTTVNYELDKTVKYTRHSAGMIKRLSVAVVVNYRKEVDSGGKVGFKALTEAEMSQINDLVKEAMGYSQDRGDSLNVVNRAFAVAEKEAVPEVPWWKQSKTYDLAWELGKNLLIGAGLLYLLLAVLKPAVTRFMESRPVATRPAEGEIGLGNGVRTVGYEENLQLAKQLARQEPKIVANVVKDWVSGDER